MQQQKRGKKSTWGMGNMQQQMPSAASDVKSDRDAASARLMALIDQLSDDERIILADLIADWIKPSPDGAGEGSAAALQASLLLLQTA